MRASKRTRKIVSGWPPSEFPNRNYAGTVTRHPTLRRRESHLKLVDVTLGHDNGYNVEISGDLRPGEMIAINVGTRTGSTCLIEPEPEQLVSSFGPDNKRRASRTIITPEISSGAHGRKSCDPCISRLGLPFATRRALCPENSPARAVKVSGAALAWIKCEGCHENL